MLLEDAGISTDDYSRTDCQRQLGSTPAACSALGIWRFYGPGTWVAVAGVLRIAVQMASFLGSLY